MWIIKSGRTYYQSTSAPLYKLVQATDPQVFFIHKGDQNPLLFTVRSAGMGFSLVLRDNQSKKKMREILLRKGQKNSAGNVIILSTTQVGSHGVILGAFTLFSLLFLFLPPISLLNSYSFALHMSYASVTSLPSPHPSSALNHLTFVSLISLPHIFPPISPLH